MPIIYNWLWQQFQSQRVGAGSGGAESFHYQEAITVLPGSSSLSMWSGSERKGYKVSTEEKHLPTTASPLKGILERDRFSIKTHTRRRKGERMRARLSHQDCEPHRPPARPPAPG